MTETTLDSRVLTDLTKHNIYNISITIYIYITFLMNEPNVDQYDGSDMDKPDKLLDVCKNHRIKNR